MYVMPRSIAVILVLWMPLVAHAEVYKWKDANGQLHFSDSPPPAAAQRQVQEVHLHADSADFTAPHKIPIANPARDSGPSIAFHSFKLELDNANGSDISIGRHLSGDDCTHSKDIMWNDGILDLKDRVAALAVAGRFRNFGYRFVDDAEGTGFADLVLDAKLLSIKLDVCSTIHTGNSFGPGSRAYVKVGWSLRQRPDAPVLYHGVSTGSYNAWFAGGGVEGTLPKAIASATDNLIGDRAFVDALTGAAVDDTLPPVRDVAVKAVLGDGRGNFRTRSQALLRSAITVRTTRGHGSGVLIDAAGYALTNAHVVGDEAQVKVMLENDYVDARVLRVDRKTDVALLQFDPEGHPAASIAPHAPQPGDQLYVIGTPLSLSLSHTITQGVLSAVRQMRGARLFQTDAAVNPGNSGGPVFDDHGDLVAISVSGLVNAEGASMNVNYLIPIRRALSAFGIAAE